MIDKMDILPISIRGRMAFGIRCIEKFCDSNSINNVNLTRLVDLLWSYTSAEWLDQWEKNILEELENINSVTDYARKYDFLYLSQINQEILVDLIEEVIEIGRANLYSAYESELTEEPTIRVAQILQQNNIDLPNINMFKISSSSEFHGWGDEVDRVMFQS